MGLDALRDLVILAEEHGLEGPQLDAAREAYCRLAGVASGEEAALGPFTAKAYKEHRDAA